MRKIWLAAILVGSFLAGCEGFRPNEDYTTLPSTNNPNLIIDSNKGSSGF
jgi:hypothetical protein